jgi:hypothetical protein
VLLRGLEDVPNFEGCQPNDLICTRAISWWHAFRRVLDPTDTPHQKWSQFAPHKQSAESLSVFEGPLMARSGL